VTDKYNAINAINVLFNRDVGQRETEMENRGQIRRHKIEKKERDESVSTLVGAKQR
jgi:hypothetical protein